MFPQSLLFSRLSHPSYLCPSSQERCSNILTIFVVSFWTQPNRFTLFLFWGCQTWILTAVEGENHLSWPASHTAFQVAQDTIGFLGWKSSLLTHAWFFILKSCKKDETKQTSPARYILAPRKTLRKSWASVSTKRFLIITFFMFIECRSNCGILFFLFTSF